MSQIAEIDFVIVDVLNHYNSAYMFHKAGKSVILKPSV